MINVPYMETAQALAKLAAGIMRQNFEMGMHKEWKDERSPVTASDIAINDAVIHEIQAHYPDHGILAEEASSYNASHEYLWICDPVDGTHNFSHGIPTATFAIALLHRGNPVLSVIMDPFENRMYYAESGKGAFLNGSPIHVSSSSSLKKNLIGLGKTRALKSLFPVMDSLYQQGVSMITGLSIHYMTALVASGEFAASIFGGKSCYDMAPSVVLIQEAGGRVSDIYGNAHDSYCNDMRGQLSSNGILHDQILSHLSLGPDLKKIEV